MKKFTYLKNICCIFMLAISCLLISCSNTKFNILTLTEAYEQNYICYDDLKEIYEIHSLNDKNLIDTLSNKDKSNIINSFNEIYNCDGKTEIVKYYGKYGSSYVVKISNDNLAYTSVVKNEKIEDLEFIYPSLEIKVFVK